MFRGRVRHVHFVGIGGIGMSGLAEILRTLDFDVSGSDLKPNENTRRLEGLGVKVFSQTDIAASGSQADATWRGVAAVGSGSPSAQALPLN